MRFYSFVNGLYFNSLQHGLQTAHAITKMSLIQHDMYKEWAENHETIIILDAGNVRELTKVYNLLNFLVIFYNDEIVPNMVTEYKDSCIIPLVDYHESEMLGNIKTCVGMVLPEYIYDYHTHHDMFDFGKLNKTETFEHGTELARKFLYEDIKVTDNLDYYTDLVHYLIYSLIKSYNLASH